MATSGYRPGGKKKKKAKKKKGSRGPKGRYRDEEDTGDQVNDIKDF